MGLGVGDHLEAVLDLAERAVVGGERAGHLPRHPARGGEAFEPLDGAADAERGVAAAGDDLPCLGEELDLADAAAAELHVVPLDRLRAGQAAMLADAQAHVVGVADRVEVEMAAPDERPQALDEGLAGRHRAGGGAGLDPGGTLPAAP